MVQGCGEQIAEVPKHVWPDRPILVITNQCANIRLADEHVEMVHPEPGQLFLELIRRVDIAQQRTNNRLAGEVVHGVLIGALRPLLLLGVGQCIGGFELTIHVVSQNIDRRG